MKSSHALLPEKPYAAYADYLRASGPSALARAQKLSPPELLDEVGRSGLRGRGGAGFPTGTKWRSVRDHPCDRRSVVCNVAEGEPGTFKDRFLLRKNPYATLEGMAIAARVVGTDELVIAVKRSFTREIERLRRAIPEMKEAGALEGLEVGLVEGPEDYLFGEEKALLNVIDGAGPLPREAHYPPYEWGLRPTVASPNPALVNNAETFAHVPGIIRHGAESFRKLGTPDTPGTLLVTLCGDLTRPGVYEVPAGLTMRELLYRFGDGPKPGRALKAVLSGVSAGVITPDKFETRCDFGSLRMIGSGLGSAGFIAVDDRTGLPRVAQTALRFLYVESCNQCTACKHGLRVASTALDALFEAKSDGAAELERALFGARSAPQANRCYLPAEAAALLPSLVSRFRAEFDLQAAKPGPRGGRWMLPKIVDFDEPSRTFIYDSRQPLKNPDWTYLEPKKTTARYLVSAPSPESEGDASFRLPPDLYETLHQMAEAKGIPLERHVEEALRQWLRERRR